MEYKELLELFNAYGLFIKPKTKNGFRIYKNDSKHRFFDWYPESGSLSKFDEYWKPVSRLKDPEDVAILCKANK